LTFFLTVTGSQTYYWATYPRVVIIWLSV